MRVLADCLAASPVTWSLDRNSQLYALDGRMLAHGNARIREILERRGGLSCLQITPPPHSKFSVPLPAGCSAFGTA